MSALSKAQSNLLHYLNECSWATPRTILRVKATGMGTVRALERRGLVEQKRSSLTGYMRVYITDAGRKLAADADD